MQKLPGQIAFKIDSRLFVKEPLSSRIGQKIIREGVSLIASEGLEQFTFKKLASLLGSTEATIYRYFLNKQQMMMYLASWYWRAKELKIAFATVNVRAPKMQLENALRSLSNSLEDLEDNEILNGTKLYHIVKRESFKAFTLKPLSKKDRIGYFLAYAQLCDRITDIIQLNNIHYQTPKALAAALIETSQHQMFLSHCLPELTDLKPDSNSLYNLLHQIAFNALEK